MYRIIDKQTGLQARNLGGYINSYDMKESADTICGMYNSHAINKSYEVRQTTEPLCNSYEGNNSSMVDLFFTLGVILMLIVLL